MYAKTLTVKQEDVFENVMHVWYFNPFSLGELFSGLAFTCVCFFKFLLLVLVCLKNDLL